jgi:hypothetical protein
MNKRTAETSFLFEKGDKREESDVQRDISSDTHHPAEFV